MMHDDDDYTFAGDTDDDLVDPSTEVCPGCHRVHDPSLDCDGSPLDSGAPRRSEQIRMRYLYLDGAILHLRNEPPLTLDQMQDLLGGYLEQIWSDLPPGQPGLIVMDNEEGLLLNLPPTVRFPAVYSVDGVLRGPVIILAFDEHGEQTDLTDAQLARVSLTTQIGDAYPTLHIRT